MIQNREWYQSKPVHLNNEPIQLGKAWRSILLTGITKKWGLFGIKVYTQIFLIRPSFITGGEPHLEVLCSKPWSGSLAGKVEVISGPGSFIVTHSKWPGVCHLKSVFLSAQIRVHSDRGKLKFKHIISVVLNFLIIDSLFMQQIAMKT